MKKIIIISAAVLIILILSLAVYSIFFSKIYKCPDSVIIGDNFEGGKSTMIVTIDGKRIDSSRIDWAWYEQNCR